MAHDVPLTTIEPVVVVTFELAYTNTPIASFVPLTALPVIVTLPPPVDEMMADEFNKTANALVPVPHDVPLILIEPVFVVT